MSDEAEEIRRTVCLKKLKLQELLETIIFAINDQSVF